MNVPAMSDTALWPPRRAIFAVGIVAVSICVFIGADLTVAFIGGTAFAVFSMGHIERRMHPTSASRSDRDMATHSTDENAANRMHSTTTTTEED